MENTSQKILQIYIKIKDLYTYATLKDFPVLGNEIKLKYTELDITQLENLNFLIFGKKNLGFAIENDFKSLDLVIQIFFILRSVS